MTNYTLTATATDNTTGKTGQNTASFIIGSSSAVISAAAGPWSANGLGTHTLSVGPTAVGNLLILAIGSGGAGLVNSLTASISGGGVTTWQRLTGYLNTGDHQLAEIWQGIVTAPGASTLTVTNASMASEWNRLWAREFTASGAGVYWQTIISSPASATTAASPSGTGSAVHYPSLTSQGFYIGIVEDSYGNLNAGSTSGFTYTTIDSHLQVAYNINASNAAPASTSSDSGERWNTCATLLTASSTPIPLSIITSSLPGGFTTQSYSQALTAAGGTPAYTWSLSAGSLPAGLSLSAAGVISGTPTTAGTSSFTVKVIDSSAHTATAVLSISVSATPPVVATEVYPPGGTYTAPALDSHLSLAGDTNLPYMDLNVWGPVSGETLTSKVYSVRNWNLTASMSNSSGSVTCFPNTGTEGIAIPWNNYSYFISGWNEQMDATTNQIASACYDNWFNNTLVNPVTGQAINEVMLHFDFRNRGDGPWFAQGVKFGGYTVNGINIPVTLWSLAYGGTAVYWNLVDGSNQITNLPIGAVDILAMNRYLVTNGFLSSTCTMAAFSIGYEICDTQGVNRSFTYNDAWWYAA
jgi:hypothetical protein